MLTSTTAMALLALGVALAATATDPVLHYLKALLAHYAPHRRARHQRQPITRSRVHGLPGAAQATDRPSFS